MTMEEGSLQRWLVADGAPVSRGQPLFEMETEKVEMEVEADSEGLLKQLVAEGTVLKPGDVVGCLLAAGEEVPKVLLERVAAQASGTSAGLPASIPLSRPGAREASAGGEVSKAPSGPLRASPVARRLAAEHGIDIATLAGSGPGGRIVEADVQRAIEAKAQAAPAPSPSLPAGRGTGGEGSTIPYSGRRRTIGERMRQSLSTMAQLTLTTEAPLDEALKMLHGLNREWRRDGVAITLTALVVRAIALALREHPRLNAHHVGNQIVVLPDVNVGLAVDLDQGLMVPVIKHADARQLKDVALAVRDLTEKAKAEKLTVDDVSGGGFTVTSLEGTGVDAFTPIINPPQAAILGVGRVRDIAAFEGDRIVRRQVTTLSLSFDHRVTDGAPAARFLDRVAELLNRPYLLM
jgi:pyruvate/2-oxoglutarate dehydrogenase complex dihydrolipoamide acyltransferase (E2) component